MPKLNWNKKLLTKATKEKGKWSKVRHRNSCGFLWFIFFQFRYVP
jgi:hypothetical protein